MKTKSKIASSKKILIASILVGVLLIGSIITVVAVLASQVQNVSSGVTVNYIVSDVGAKVSAKYYVVNPSSGVAAQSVTMTNGSESEIEFGVADSSTTKALTPSGEVNLSSTNSRIIYEYKFTNTTESAFKISLVGVPETVDNMTVTYKSLGSALSNYATTFSDITLKTQLLVEKDATVYIYISVQVISINQPAEYTGNITWKLEAAKTLSTLTLNNGTGTGGQTSIKYLADNAVQLPHLTSVPTSGSKLFLGYFANSDGTGTQYYDTNGNSIAGLSTANATVYAKFGEETVVMSGKTVTGLTTAGSTSGTAVIPEIAEAIDDNAFLNQTSLTSVKFAGATATQAYADGSSLTTIGDNAFKGCSNITKLVIPEGVTEVGEGCFQNMTNLIHLVLPTTLTSVPIAKSYYVEDWDWYEPLDLNIPILTGSRNLEMFELNTDILVYSNSSYNAFDYMYGAADYQGDWYGEKSTEIKEIIINSGTNIKDYAFCNCTSIISITIPSSVTSIGEYAFKSCSGLMGITFAENSKLTSIGDYAFSECSGLISITIPSSVTSIGEYAFKSCSGLMGITFAENSKLTSIGDYVFKGCSNTTNLVIPEGVTEVGKGCFQNMTSLRHLVLPTTLTSVPYNNRYEDINIPILSGSQNLNTLECNVDMLNISTNAYGYCGLDFLFGTATGESSELWCGETSPITEVVINSGTINNNAFHNCTRLNTIALLSSVTSIERYAFSGCSSLTSVTFEDITGWTCDGSSIDVTNTTNNATNLRNTSSSSSPTDNWGYYTLKKNAS